MDKRLTEGKSTCLEKGCFEKGLKMLTDAGLNIIEVVTNAHPKIGALLYCGGKFLLVEECGARRGSLSLTKLSQVCRSIIERSTSDLESFQNLILAYTSKRHAYSPPVYRVRNQLAALDHNIHVGRPTVTKDDGTPRFLFLKRNKKMCQKDIMPCSHYDLVFIDLQILGQSHTLVYI